MLLFSAPSCAPCIMLKKYLQNHNVKYVEKLASGEEYEHYAKQFGWIKPLLVKGDKGVSGLNFSAINELL